MESRGINELTDLGIDEFGPRHGFGDSKPRSHARTRQPGRENRAAWFIGASSLGMTLLKFFFDYRSRAPNAECRIPSEPVTTGEWRPATDDCPKVHARGYIAAPGVYDMLLALR